MNNNQQNKNRHTRQGNIELLRFIFSLCIVLHHAMLDDMPMGGGWLSVEFFFLLNGVFLGRTIKKQGNKNNFQEIMRSDAQYLKRRIRSIFPFFFLATIIGFAVNVYVFSLSINLELILKLINDFFFLQSFGMPLISATGVVWYLSSMFFALWVLYPIASKWYSAFTYYVTPIMAMFCMGIMIHTYGTLNVPNEFLFGIICTGFMRSFSMIGLGFLCNECSDKIANKLSDDRGVLITIIECALYCFIIWYMHIWTVAMGGFDELIVFSMFLALSISLSGKSKISEMADNPISRTLGEYSVSLFLSHFYWVQYISQIASKLNIDVTNIGYVGLLLSFITAGIVMAAGKFIQRIWNKRFGF